MKKRVIAALTVLCLALMVLPIPAKADRGLLDGVPDGFVFHLGELVSDDDFCVMSDGWYAFEVTPAPQSRYADIMLFSYLGESAENGKMTSTGNISLNQEAKHWNKAGDAFFAQMKSGLAYNIEVASGKIFDVTIRYCGAAKPADIASFEIDTTYFLDNGATTKQPSEEAAAGKNIAVALFDSEEEADEAFLRYDSAGQYAIVVYNLSYRISKLIVTSDDGTSFAVGNDGTNVFTFTMPNASVSLSYEASWDEEPGYGYGSEYKNPFVDVSEHDPFYDAVRFAVEFGITTGTSDTTFSPQMTVTRAQAMTFLWRSQGCPEPTSNISFTDVKPTDWFYKAVLWAVEKDITNGTGDGKFSPDQTCTHAHMVTFSWRFLGEKDKTGQGAWYDDALSWYVGALRQMIAAGDEALDEAGVSGIITEEMLENVTRAIKAEASCSRADAVEYIYLDNALMVWDAYIRYMAQEGAQS